MPKIKDLQNLSIKQIAMIIGIITGSLTIGVFASDIYNGIGKLIVTDAELVIHEERIIAKIRSEAVLTRNVFIRDLTERKTKLTDRLDETENPGRIAQILEEIKVLNERINELRGE